MHIKIYQTNILIICRDTHQWDFSNIHKAFISEKLNNKKGCDYVVLSSEVNSYYLIIAQRVPSLKQ